MGHQPGLDGLRGFAILLVIANHAGVPWFYSGGTAGVTVFFVLSGFLITSLLLEEQDNHGCIRLVDFYIRRARRLLPALLAFLAGVAILVATGVLHLPWSALLPPLLYFQNWTMAAGAPVTPVTHTWSLSIEEQYYLLWPAFLLGVGFRVSRKVLFGILLVGVISSVITAAALVSNDVSGDRIYYGLDTRAASLLAGCALAVAMRHGWVKPAAAGRIAPLAIAAIVALGFQTSGLGKYVMVPLVVTVLTIRLIVVAVSVPHSAGFELPWLRFIGKRSYGLYLWHTSVLLLLLPVLGPWWVGLPTALGASLLLTEGSWRLVERPALRSRRLRDSSSTILLSAQIQPSVTH